MADQQIVGAHRTPLYYYLFLGLLAFVVTASSLQHSMRCGRLAIPPQFDDVGYMYDAAKRVDLFWREGVIPEVRLYIQNPPHSPWSTALACVGFLTFGIRDWAPYAMNFTVVLSYLLFADYLLGKARIWQKLICFVFLLSMPIIPESVAEFRPDHACSLFTVIACMLLLEHSVTRASRKRLAIIGAMFGLAMFTKPSTFPAVIILMFACLVMRTTADALSDETPLTFGNIARAWVIIVGVSVLAAMVYFSVGLHEIVTYIHDNMFGQYQSVWKYRGDFQSALHFDLTGDGGKAQLGDDLPLLRALLIIGGIYSAVVSTRAEKARITVFAFLLLGTFMMAMMNHMKSQFTGLTFQTCLVLMAIWVFAFILNKSSNYPWLLALVTSAVIAATVQSQWTESTNHYGPSEFFTGYIFITSMVLVIFGVGYYIRTGKLGDRWGWSVVICAALAALAQFQWPKSWGDYNDQLATSRRQMASGIYETIIQHLTPGHNRVMIQGIMDINPSLFSYMAVKNQQNVVFWSPDDSDKMDPVIEQWNNFDFVVASQQGTGVTADFNLQYHTLDALLTRLKARSDFKEIGFYPFVFTGKGYYVFQKVTP